MIPRPLDLSKESLDNGYDKKYRYSIFLNSDGVVEDYIHWCEKNCKGRWGWWYITHPDWDIHWDSSKNKAYMSFSRRREALAFWFANCEMIYDTDYGKD